MVAISIALLMLAGPANGQRTISRHQESVALDDYQTAIWAPRPGNVNNEIVGEQVIPEELLAEYFDLHSGFQHEAAARVARELVALCPERPEGYYNLACSLAQLRRHEEALQALDSAIDHGWRYLRHTWLDPDLETLRDKADFGALMMKMARLEHRERVMPRPLREDELADVQTSLREVIPQLLDTFDVPGVTVALVQDGAFVWTEAFGYSNAHDQVPMVVHDQFELHSPVDVMAVVAAHQQSARGLDLAQLLEQADELDLRQRPQRLARGTVPRYVDVDRELRARLLAHDDEMAGAVARDRRRGLDRSIWPLSQVIPRTLDWVALAIEQVTGDSFYGYCKQHILRPAGMQETVFALPAQRSRGQNDRSETTNNGEVVSSDEASALVIGHTRFGTPLAPVDRPARTRIAPVRTTAADLARLMAAIMQSSPRPFAGNINDFAAGGDDESHGSDAEAATNGATTNGHSHIPPAPERPAALTNGPLEELLESSRLQQAGLGLEVHLDQTVAGPRMQVIENSDGIGMLMRWYPESGNGIVVLFNSENGPDAAIRIAHEALGGE